MRRQHIALACGIILLGTIGCFAALVVWPRLVEEWHLGKLGSKVRVERQRAAEALGKLRSERAVPVLIDLLVKEAVKDPPGEGGDYPFCYTAAMTYYEALRAMGEAALPGLTRAVRSDDSREKMWAAAILRFNLPGPKFTGPASPAILEARAALLAELREDAWGRQYYLTEALAACGPGVVAEIATILQDGEARARKDAVDVLYNLSATDETVALLKNAAVDADASVRTAAVGCLIRGRWGVVYDARDLRQKADEEAGGRLTPAQVEELKRLERHARDIDSFLLERLNDPEGGVVQLLLKDLDYVHSYDRQDIVLSGPTLERVLALSHHPDASVRGSVMDLLDKTDRPDAAVAALAGALEDEDWSVRHSAAETLQELGARAQAGVPRLIEVLVVDNNIRHAVVGALAAIGAPAVPDLLVAADHDSPWVRLWVLDALVNMPWGSGKPGAELLQPFALLAWREAGRASKMRIPTSARPRRRCSARWIAWCNMTSASCSTS